MAIELAKAYVQIVPSAEGIQGKITEMLGGEASSAGESIGKVLGSRIAAVAISAISAAGIGKAISSAVSAGADLEQSIGGVETLFGDAADTIKQYAADAYKTAGLSANSYMEQATSFAASLVSSMGGDTAAAAEVANQALIDMSDNANKMGTDMQSIQNAYQGFAKRIYTMLDNLKLGYGGTKTEMERLLADAQAITGVEYNIDNLSDVYNAIHVIQEDLNITGTTAQEAATTVSGSMASMKAAFENVLGSLATGEELGTNIQALIDTAQVYLTDNLIPMVQTVIMNLPQVLIDTWPTILDTGITLIDELAQTILESCTNMLETIGNSLTTAIPEMMGELLPKVLEFTDNLRDNFGEFVDAGIDLIMNLADGIIAALPDLFAYIPDIVINIAGLINDNAPKILLAGVQLIGKLIEGIIQAIPQLVANLPKVIQAIVSVITAFNWINLGGQIMTGIGNGIKSMTTSLTNAVKSGFSGALNWIKNLPSQALSWGKNLMQNFMNGINGAKATAMLAGELVSIAEANYTPTSDDSMEADKAEVNAIKMENLSKSAANSASSAATSAGSAVTSATKASAASTKATSAVTTTAAKTAEKAAATVVDTLTDITTTSENGVEKTIKTITETLSDGTSRQKKTITETGEEIVNGVVKTYEKITQVAADGSQTVSKTLKDVEIAEDTMVHWGDAADLLTSQFKTSMEEGWTDINKAIKEDALGAAQTLMDAVMDGDWQQIGKWAASYFWSGCTEEQQNALMTLAAQAITPLESGLQSATQAVSGYVSSLIAKLVPALGLSATAQSVLNVVMDANPILLVVSLIGMLVSALINFAKKNENVAKAFKAVWHGIANVLLTVVEICLRVLGSMVQGFVNAINAMIAVANVLPGVNIGYVKNPIYNLADKVASYKTKINDDWNSEKDSSDSSNNKSTASVIKTITDTYSATVDGLAATVKEVTKTYSDGTSELTKTITTNEKKTINGVLKSIETVKTIAADGTETISQTIKEATEDAADKVSDAITGETEKTIDSTAKQSLWHVATGAVANRAEKAKVEVNQYIYSKAQTAADLMREARWEQERAVLMGV